jgi:hypothetical protein
LFQLGSESSANNDLKMEFFDAAAPSSQATTFRVISTISDDAYAIQDFLAEKVLISPCTRMQRDTLVF